MIKLFVNEISIEHTYIHTLSSPSVFGFSTMAASIFILGQVILVPGHIYCRFVKSLCQNNFICLKDKAYIPNPDLRNCYGQHEDHKASILFCNITAE
jgi:hypothetical protein